MFRRALFRSFLHYIILIKVKIHAIVELRYTIYINTWLKSFFQLPTEEQKFPNLEKKHLFIFKKYLIISHTKIRFGYFSFVYFTHIDILNLLKNTLKRLVLQNKHNISNNKNDPNNLLNIWDKKKIFL